MDALYAYYLRWNCIVSGHLPECIRDCLLTLCNSQDDLRGLHGPGCGCSNWILIEDDAF